MIIRSQSIRAIIIILILLLPFTLSVISISHTSETKDIFCKEHSGSSVLFVGDFCYFNLSLNVDAEKVCIISYYGDFIPDLWNRSVKNYYRWDFDNGMWLDNSGHISSFINTDKCVKNNNSYSFFIKVDSRATPGRWNIKILIDDEEVDKFSNSYVFVAQFSLFFTAIIGIYEPINNDKKTIADIELFDSQKNKIINQQKEEINNIVDIILDRRNRKKRETNEDKLDICYFCEKNPYFKEELVKTSVSTYHKSKLKSNIKNTNIPFFLKNSMGGGKNNFFTNKKSFSYQRILVSLVTIILISLSFIPIINTQDIKVSSGLSITSFNLYPNKIYINDSILLNTTVSGSIGINSVVAEINSFEKINMTFVEGDVVNNTIYSGFWQGSWMAYNMSPGNYSVEVIAYGEGNCSISRQSFFDVLSKENITYANNTKYQSKINETDKLNNTYIQNITRPGNNSVINVNVNNWTYSNISNLTDFFNKSELFEKNQNESLNFNKSNNISESVNSKSVQNITETVYIVDKKHEQMHILPGTRFYVDRTIDGPHGTRIIFVPMFSDALTLESVEIIDKKENITYSNISSNCKIDSNVFMSGNARCKRELDIQERKDTLDENIKNLDKIAYVDDVVLQSPRTIRMWFRAPSWEEIQKNKKETSGEISYLVFSYDINGSLDFEGSTWWNIDWLYRKEINVTTGANYPYNGYDGYTVKLSGLDTTNNSKFQSDGDDIRIVYWNGAHGVELDRELRNTGTINTSVIFRLQADIAANDYDNNYSLYYGNSDVGPGPSNQSNIYLWYDNATVDRESQYTQGRIDATAHGSDWGDTVVWNAAGYYTYYTDDNYAESLRPVGIEERDIYVEFEEYQTNAFPTDMTSGPIVRWNGTGSGASEDSSHWYYYEMADSAYLGGSYTSHDDITADDRNSVIVSYGNLGTFPQNTWTRLGIASWDINPTNLKAFYNNESGGWNGSRFSGTHASGSDNEHPGEFGAWIQQDAGRIRNLLARRYIEPEPILNIGNEEIDTIVNKISPYIVTYKPYNLTANGPNDLDNVTLYYRYSADNISWDDWVENETDEDPLWQWDFRFPNGTGYYEFYSIGKLLGASIESAPTDADASCYFNASLNTVPEIVLLNPSPNGADDVSPLPICQILVNDKDGDSINVSWYENSTGSFLLRNFDSNVPANSSINHTFTEFSDYFNTYWWKVEVNDTMDNTSSIFYFTTEIIDTSIDTIFPYEVTTTPRTITATGNSDLDNVTLYYRYSTNNNSVDWGTIGEVRKCSNIDNSWYTLNFWNTYNDPVIVASYNLVSDANNEAVVRISSVTSTSCRVRIQNPGDDHSVTAGDVYVIIMEEGAYNLSDGTKVEAHNYLESTTSYKGSWSLGTSQTYSNSYTSPVVFGQVMSQNDADWSTFWCSNGGQTNPPDSSNLYTSKFVGEDTDTTRNSEVIGYIVIEQSTGIFNGIKYSASLGSDIVEGVDDSPPYSYSLGDSYSVGVVTKAAEDGGDGGFSVLYGNSPINSNINLAIDEDTIGDTERSHTTEQVGYWVFENEGNITSDNETEWIMWNNVSNPDQNSPWGWNFDFPNGTGYYEFYSIGRKSGSPIEATPNRADAKCYHNFSLPTSPIINNYDLINSTGSKLNNASGLIDVNAEYRFSISITEPNGWADIEYINVTAWYDNGSETTSYNQTSGGNLNMFLQYKNTSGVAQFNLIWPDDEVQIVTDNCSETIVSIYTRVINLSFVPLSQVRWADSNKSWDGTQNSTNDVYSWNFNVSVTDLGGLNTWLNDEYGVYKYTSHFLDQDWVDVYAAPGFSDDSNVVTITYSSNYNFNMSLYFEENLYNSSYDETILIANNVDILAAADFNDDITSDITFLGIGEVNAVDIFNDSGIFHTNNVSQTVNVQFEIYIPIGILGVKYKARVATKVIQK